jgi:hypothetical protein
MSIQQTVSMLFADSSLSIGEIVIDAVLEEVHALEAQVTEHPVESGRSVVDHVQVLSDSLRLEGIISNTPTSFLGMPLSQSENRVDSAFKQFQEIIRTGKLIDIVTTLKTYKNMAIEDFVVTRNASNAEALCFSCSAKRVRIVSSHLIEIKVPKIKRVHKKKSVGKQPAVKAPEPVEKRARSLLSTLLGG